MMQIKGFSPQ